jgi:hypothetical protein
MAVNPLPKQFTPQDDKAFFLEIVALPAQRLLSILVFIALRRDPSRERMLQVLKALGT